MKWSKTLKKTLILFLALCLVKAIYYYVMVRPIEKLWDYAMQVMSGEVQPSRDDKLSIYNLSTNFTVETRIEYEAKRLFVWHSSQKGIIVLSYSQTCYDTSGKWLTAQSDLITIWRIENKYDEWKVVGYTGRA